MNTQPFLCVHHVCTYQGIGLLIIYVLYIVYSNIDNGDTTLNASILLYSSNDRATIGEG